MTQQLMFGGHWTQLKLQILSKYLRAYRQIFESNQRARHFQVSYVDAFAGTGVIPRPQLEGTFAELMPDLAANEEEFRKGSVRRALEVEPPFHRYIFIEKDFTKCAELSILAKEFSTRNVRIINDDGNQALLKWCEEMDTRLERAVIFLDPFGASVEWNVIEAIAKTKAVDLWILFPYSAINRMLTANRKPPAGWAERLNRFFGTDKWEDAFYSQSSWISLLNPNQEVERVHKTADGVEITQFFLNRLEAIFAEVAKPGFLFNSKGLLFVLFFAAGNERGAKTGVKIANDLLRELGQS
jgi:three-Cys-motif partner protein